MLRRILDKSGCGTEALDDYYELSHGTFGQCGTNRVFISEVQNKNRAASVSLDREVSVSLDTENFRTEKLLKVRIGDPVVQAVDAASPVTSSAEDLVDKEATNDLLRIYMRQMHKYRSVDEAAKLELTEKLRQANQDLIHVLSEFPGTIAWFLRECKSAERTNSSSKDRDDDSKNVKVLSNSKDKAKTSAKERYQNPNKFSQQSNESANSRDATDLQLNGLSKLYRALLDSVERLGVDHVVCIHQRKTLQSAFCQIQHSPNTLIRMIDVFLDPNPPVDTIHGGTEFQSNGVNNTQMFEVKYGISMEQHQTILTRARRAYKRWQQARNQLVEVHLGLVLFLAKQYSNDAVDKIDLIQEGNLGLIKAVERFDPELGYKFSTYAGYWIRLALSRCSVRYGRTVRLPFRVNENIVSMNKHSVSMNQSMGRRPTEAEIAQVMDISLVDVRKCNFYSQNIASMDAAFDAGEPSKNLHALLEQETIPEPLDSVARQYLQTAVSQSIAGLNERESFVVRQRYGIGNYGDNTLQELGNTLGLTRERIRQIEISALKKLRRRLKALYNGSIE